MCVCDADARRVLKKCKRNQIFILFICKYFKSYFKILICRACIDVIMKSPYELFHVFVKKLVE